MPGVIIRSLRDAGANNPVLMIDEIDKMGADFRGDPASAMLEVLDPEQNATFRDHYMDMPFDLSHVLFITTANQLDPIPGPLRDRMEIMQLAGYTEQEKLQIAKRYLVPRQIDRTRLDDSTLALSYVKANARKWGADRPEEWLRTHDIHVHVPSGAIPKDGPSAGTAIATALVSLVSGRPVRSDVAMTGEITLTGQVLPIGGLKEKALAAQRAGIKCVMAPKLNEPHLEDVPPHLRKSMEFKFVSKIDQVLKLALEE